MALGIVGRKCGMTRLFTEDGSSIPVTVVHVEPNFICQLKTTKTDGYSAIQVTTGKKKRSTVNQAEAGHFAKAKAEPGRGLWEFRLDDSKVADFEIGQSVDASMFEVGQKVDITGISKGKGFAGVIKRHNFAMQDATHGNSLSHRAHGSTGQNQTPGRVFKNKKMAGHLGDVQTTVQTLEIMRVDVDKDIVLVRGSIPGSQNSDVVITPAVKAKVKKA
jgi:large subunit ribosomal protein L3